MSAASSLIDRLGTAIYTVAAFQFWIAGFFKMLAKRMREHGNRSGWIYFRTRANKLYVELRNTWGRSTRSECPCCGWKGYDFLPLDGVSFWVKRNYCPQCYAFDRHRALYAYITRHDPGVRDAHGVLLNYAPEPVVTNLFRGNNGLQYVATDLFNDRLRALKGHAFRSDIFHIPLRDETASIAFCLHLLEHLKDDRAAIAQLHRVLKPGGILYVMVPIDLRLQKSEFFGTPRADIFDHYWSYALDFVEKFSDFECRAIHPKDYLTDEERFRYAIEDREVIFRSVKPGGRS